LENKFHFSIHIYLFMWHHHVRNLISQFFERKNGIMKRWPQKDTSRALHFGKHCSRMKANETRWWRFLPRSEEQLDTREPSRLQSSLYRILRKREKAGGWRRDRHKDKGKSEMGARERAQWRTRNSSRCTVRRIFGNETQQDLVQLTALRRQKRKW